MYIPDNYDLFVSHEHRQEKRLVMLPKCQSCEEPIQDEYCYGEDGQYICESCLKTYYRVSTDTLIYER